MWQYGFLTIIQSLDLGCIFNLDGTVVFTGFFQKIDNIFIGIDSLLHSLDFKFQFRESVPSVSCPGISH